MILHLVNRSPQQSQALELCLRFAAPEDTLLLLEDGVSAATTGHRALPSLQSATLKQVAALSPDLVSRGLAGHVAAGIATISYDQFVALACECEKVQSWF